MECLDPLKGKPVCSVFSEKFSGVDCGISMQPGLAQQFVTQQLKVAKGHIGTLYWFLLYVVYFVILVI